MLGHTGVGDSSSPCSPGRGPHHARCMPQGQSVQGVVDVVVIVAVVVGVVVGVVVETWTPVC